MESWFVWKDRNSANEGLWVSKLPNITRGVKRHEEIIIPGRSGTLLLAEGEDVYDSYVKECVVTVPSDRDIQDIMAWLRGTGEVVFSNEPDKIYNADIVGEVSFTRVGNCLLQATIPFFVQPIKHLREETEITITEPGGISNPGDVTCKPYVTFTATGTVTISIHDKSMTFEDMQGETISVDCENQIVWLHGYPSGIAGMWEGAFSGEFWEIPPGGTFVVTLVPITIKARWGWV